MLSLTAREYGENGMKFTTVAWSHFESWDEKWTIGEKEPAKPRFGLSVLQQWLYSMEAGATAPNNLWIDMDINVWNQIGSI
jgi:hypothetical protein